MGMFVGQSVEDILGPANARYFGAGYRRVTHSIQTLDVDETSAAVVLQAIGTAKYPGDWSLDAAGQPRRIHLSSFDAIALTAAAMRAAAPSNTRAQALRSGVVRRVQVKAPARVVSATESIDVAVESTERSPDGSMRVTSRVGGFAVEVTVMGDDNGHPVDLQLHDDGQSAGIGSGKVVRTAGEIHTVHELAVVPTALTCVEELAMFGQLSQVAVYAEKGLNRRSVPNLWLRRLTLNRSAIPPTHPVESRTRITRDRLLRVGGEDVIDLTLASEASYGASAEASFGFRVP
jgi:hypothetical protein